MADYRFAGYRVVEFPAESKTALKELAERLVPHETEIVSNWVKLQCDAWQPPGLSKDQLTQLFGGLLHNIFGYMASTELERCMTYLEDAGIDLAGSNFPYEALILSLHFLEESYMPFLLKPRSDRAQEWLIRMDEFLHAGIATLATAYFQFHREQLLAEAEIGRIVQEALLPHPPKTLSDLEIGFVYASASEKARLGGDFLDVFSYKDGGVAFVVGDLSGHGLEAAADATMIRNLFKGFLFDGADLTDAVNRLNRVLSEELEMHQFATALAGSYEQDGRLTLVNAGGPMPIICNKGISIINQPGLPLGVNRDAIYEQLELKLEAGDILLSFTDGLSEARVGVDLFGEERVISAFTEVQDTPARAIAEHLMDKALHYAHGRLLDDMAILVLKRLPND